MDIKFFLNDYYDILKLMHDNEASSPEADEPVVLLTQQQIADAMNCSKMKINGMFIVLQRERLIKQKTRVLYSLTDRAKAIVKALESFREQLEAIE